MRRHSHYSIFHPTSAAVGQYFRTCEEQIRLIQVQGADMGISNKDYVLRQNVQRNRAFGVTFEAGVGALFFWIWFDCASTVGRAV